MKDTLAIIGISTMLALTLVMFLIFVTAYVSPVKAVRVNIDNYGEAHLELVLLSMLLPINIFSTFFVTKSLTEKRQTKPQGEAF